MFATDLAQLKMFMTQNKNQLNKINSQLTEIEQLYLLTESQISNNNYEQALALSVQAGNIFQASRNLITQFHMEYAKEWPKHHEKMLTIQNRLLKDMEQGIYPAAPIDACQEDAMRNSDETEALSIRIDALTVRRNRISAAITKGMQAHTLTPRQNNSELSKNTVSHVRSSMFSPKINEPVVLGCEAPIGSFVDENGTTIVPQSTTINRGRL